ncbi:hypothetical protein BH09BAC5_BH09BAC5_23310 [soil metagenome]
MKNILLFFVCSTAFLSISAQEKNQVCYKDTSIVERSFSRFDTTYTVRDLFRKGDWEMFYDFGLTKKMADYHFNNEGNKTGNCLEWYENGKSKSEFNYSDSWFPSFPIGKYFYSNGALKMERIALMDTLTETTFFYNTKISKIRKWTKSGLLVQESQWCENGQLVLNYNPTSSIPVPVKKYFCNGKLKAEYNWYVYGYTGAFLEYYDNGQLSLKGQFQELPSGATIFMARKTGDWIYYDTSGNITKTEHWDTGKLIKTEK